MGHQIQTAGGGGFHDPDLAAFVARDEAELCLSRPLQRIVNGGRQPLAVERLEQRVECPLASVGDRADIDGAPVANQAALNRLGDLERSERALERVGGDEDDLRDSCDDCDRESMVTFSRGDGLAQRRAGSPRNFRYRIIRVDSASRRVVRGAVAAIGTPGEDGATHVAVSRALDASSTLHHPWELSRPDSPTLIRLRGTVQGSMRPARTRLRAENVSAETSQAACVRREHVSAETPNLVRPPRNVSGETSIGSAQATVLLVHLLELAVLGSLVLAPAQDFRAVTDTTGADMVEGHLDDKLGT